MVATQHFGKVLLRCRTAWRIRFVEAFKVLGKPCWKFLMLLMCRINFPKILKNVLFMRVCKLFPRFGS